MFSREPPDQSRRHIQLAQVTNHTAENLIRSCIEANPANRPTMEEVIVQLENIVRELHESENISEIFDGEIQPGTTR